MCTSKTHSPLNGSTTTLRMVVEQTLALARLLNGSDDDLHDRDAATLAAFMYCQLYDAHREGLYFVGVPAYQLDELTRRTIEDPHLDLDEVLADLGISLDQVQRRTDGNLLPPPPP
jgi:hypothetical protein